MIYEYNCVIDRVVDGDTVDVDIDLGFGVWLRNQRIRINAIDAPETRTRNSREKLHGLAAKEFVEFLLPRSSRQHLLSTSFEGKYGRIIGDFNLYYPPHDCVETLSTILVEEKHAIPYTTDFDQRLGLFEENWTYRENKKAT